MSAWLKRLAYRSVSGFVLDTGVSHEPIRPGYPVVWAGPGLGPVVEWGGGPAGLVGHVDKVTGL